MGERRTLLSKKTQMKKQRRLKIIKRQKSLHAPALSIELDKQLPVVDCGPSLIDDVGLDVDLGASSQPPLISL